MSSVERHDPAPRPAGLRIIAKGEVTRILNGPATDREARVAAVSAAADRFIDHARQRGELPDPVRRSGMSGPNERLERAMLDAGLTPEQLAAKVQVDVKTVERWINTGRVPFKAHRFAVSEQLDARVSDLWPEPPARTSRPKTPEQANETLRQAMLDARMTPEQLADRLGMHAKTVERWITTGRLPHRKHRMETAVAVGVPERDLWPAPARPHVLAQDHTERVAPEPGASQPQTGTERDDQSAYFVSARTRACMSWVDTSKTADRAQPPTPPAAPARQNYSRSYGVERSR